MSHRRQYYFCYYQIFDNIILTLCDAHQYQINFVITNNCIIFVLQSNIKNWFAIPNGGYILSEVVSSWWRDHFVYFYRRHTEDVKSNFVISNFLIIFVILYIFTEVYQICKQFRIVQTPVSHNSINYRGRLLFYQSFLCASPYLDIRYLCIYSLLESARFLWNIRAHRDALMWWRVMNALSVMSDDASDDARCALRWWRKWGVMWMREHTEEKGVEWWASSLIFWCVMGCVITQVISEISARGCRSEMLGAADSGRTSGFAPN